MLRIRLARTGKKHAPSYRIIVAEKRSKRDGKYIDLLGYWNPSHNPPQFKIDQQKIKDWQAKGAQLSAAVAKLIKQNDSNSKTSKTKKGTN